jgi:hemerythrin-like domain-containing protein
VLAAESAARAEEKAKTDAKPAAKEIEVTPNEDLMREHGVLRRIIILYDEAATRLEASKDLPLETVSRAAGIVRKFAQDYHENLEEVYLFPRFEKAGILADLVKVLRDQHKAGRRLMDEALAILKADEKTAVGRARLAKVLRLFNRLYTAHAAHEDTVLFPAVRKIMTPKEYDTMGDRFEDAETNLFGEHGFEKVVEQVAGLEKTLGLADLAQFTPPA